MRHTVLAGGKTKAKLKGSANHLSLQGYVIYMEMSSYCIGGWQNQSNNRKLKCYQRQRRQLFSCLLEIYKSRRNSCCQLSLMEELEHLYTRMWRARWRACAPRSAYLRSLLQQKSLWQWPCHLEKLKSWHDFGFYSHTTTSCYSLSYLCAPTRQSFGLVGSHWVKSVQCVLYWSPVCVSWCPPRAGFCRYAESALFPNQCMRSGSDKIKQMTSMCHVQYRNSMFMDRCKTSSSFWKCAQIVAILW